MSVTYLVGSVPTNSKGNTPARPLIFASNQLVFSCSNPPSAIVYLELCSSAFTAYVVVTCTSAPPSSTVRTIAVFSKECPADTRDGTNSARRMREKPDRQRSIIVAVDVECKVMLSTGLMLQTCNLA